MLNFFKKTLFLCLISAAATAYASNALDGVYYCTTTIPGNGTMSSYNAVLTNASGVTGFAVMNVSPGTQAYGYGTGTASASSFTGTDMNGKPFSLTANGTTMAGSLYVTVGSLSIASTTSCLKVW